MVEAPLKSVLLVVNSYVAAHDLRRDMPDGWIVAPFFGVLFMAQRFDLILVPKFNDHDSASLSFSADKWVEFLATKLTDGGKIVRI